MPQTEYIPYDKNYTYKSHGFINLGNTCYFNSLLQCLISCPSIFKALDNNRHLRHIATNPLAQSLLALNDFAKQGASMHDKCIPIWRSVLAISQKRQDNVRMDMNQQDAHEGLMMLLDVLDTLPEVKRLFEHRHRIRILCEHCRKWVVDREEVNMTFEVQSDLKTEQKERFKIIDKHYNQAMDLNEFLRNHNGFVDADFKCPTPGCGKTGPKFKTVNLMMVPEILPIVIKKYNKKTTMPFPLQLEFLSSDKKNKMVYGLVAQSEHSGSMGGGHYWAVCLRADGWKLLNDASVSDGTPGPTLHSYVLFYHLFHFQSII